MTETVTFYQIYNELKDKTLCQLLAKIYNAGFKAVVRFTDESTQEQINKTLWSFSQKEFIPHGSKLDPNPGRQPIYLTTTEENPNNATVLVQVGKGELPNAKYQRIIFIFDGTDVSELEFAKQKYISYKKQYFNIEYWQQTPKGTWEKLENEEKAI